MSGKKDLVIRGLRKSREWDYENGFYWFSGPERLGKMCAQYELYKRITGLPGDVLEFGVYKAASLLRWVTFRNLLESPRGRKVVGFDAFGKFPDQVSLDGDKRFIERFEAAGGDGLSLAETQALLRGKGLEDNVRLVEGDVLKTLSAYLAENDQCRIALLHLDMDVYEPTRHVLELCWERLVPGGLVVVDDYNAVPGATRAVDELLRRHGLRIEKLPMAHVPAFIVAP